LSGCKPTQAVGLKQGVLANLGNPSKESLDTDVSVGVNSASGFVGAAIVHHGLPPMAIDIGLFQSPFLV